MKRSGCLIGGCLGLGLVFAVLVIVTLLFFGQQNLPETLPVNMPQHSPMPSLPGASATLTEDTNSGIVIVTVQTTATPAAVQQIVSPQAVLPTATPAAPVGAPFFSAQTVVAQQSATAMWIARTAWFGTLTQSALDHAATLRALGTPGR